MRTACMDGRLTSGRRFETPGANAESRRVVGLLALDQTTPPADRWSLGPFGAEFGRISVVRLVQLLLLAGVYVLAALVSYPMTDLPIPVSSMWLPSGVAVLMVLRGRNRMLPLVLLCHMFADATFGGFAPITAAGIGMVAAGEAWLAVTLLRGRGGEGFRFEIPVIVRFAVGVLALAPMISALVAAGWLTLVGTIEAGEMLGLWRNWAVSSAMGILLVVPLLESWRQHGPPRFQGEAVEAMSVLLVLALLLIAIFAYELGDQEVLRPVLYSSLFLMIWCALYFRESGATTSFAAAILIGSFANAHWSAEPVPSWVVGVYAVPFALVGMIVAAVQTRLEQVAASRARQEELERLAYEDGLTGLANRVEFERRLAAATRQAAARDARVAVVFIDLDGFKPLNDTYGHQAGDDVLMTVARRLRQAVRPADVAARVGGDEFTALLTDVATPADAHGTAERLREAIEAPIEWGGQRLRVGASVGVAVYPDHAATPMALVRQADEAMYAAKHSPDRAVVDAACDPGGQTRAMSNDASAERAARA